MRRMNGETSSRCGVRLPAFYANSRTMIRGSRHGRNERFISARFVIESANHPPSGSRVRPFSGESSKLAGTIDDS